MDDTDRPARPPATASEAEIAEWRAKDFGWALATGPDEDDTRNTGG